MIFHKGSFFVLLFLFPVGTSFKTGLPAKADITRRGSIIWDFVEMGKGVFFMVANFKYFVIIFTTDLELSEKNMERKKGVYHEAAECKRV